LFAAKKKKKKLDGEEEVRRRYAVTQVKKIQKLDA
jgi:hypothetical protein